MDEQNKRHSELYNSALKRARQSDADSQATSIRVRQLEAEILALENAREHTVTERDKVQFICNIE